MILNGTGRDIVALPRMGVKIFKNIRKKRPRLPIIIITDQNSVDNQLKGFNLGADDYLVKPFCTGELLGRVKAVLRRSPKKRRLVSYLKIPNVKIFFERREVHIGNNNIVSLSEQECNLLKYLANNDNRIISRKELLLHVWERNDYKPTTRTVDAHISRLRDKLPFFSEAISTIRKRGYMFVS